MPAHLNGKPMRPGGHVTVHGPESPAPRISQLLAIWKLHDLALTESIDEVLRKLGRDNPGADLLKRANVHCPPFVGRGSVSDVAVNVTVSRWPLKSPAVAK
jgi:hypothetical protein